MKRLEVRGWRSEMRSGGITAVKSDVTIRKD